MEISDERLPDAAIGAQVAAGRESTIHAVGDDRLLRRSLDPTRSVIAEAQAMEALRLAGYPVPVVHRVGPAEMVLERVPGRTMLDDMSVHPWRLRSHARLLADLHLRLHRMTPPPGLRPVLGDAGSPGDDAVLHLDLHPGNVILSPRGPVVIDWTNVAMGPAAADVALTWMVLAPFDIDDAPLLRFLALGLRQPLVHWFVGAAGRAQAAAALPAVAEYRSGDRNTRPSEREAIERLVARHAT